MKIDRAILRYKEILTRIVNDHNQKRVAAGQKQDWFMVDLHWALERLAFRRYAEDPSVPPPPDWSPYQLPAAIEALKLDTRFLMAEQGKRISGGIFSLDGIHPTTVGYGIVAQECINKMQEAGVHFFRGVQKTPRTGPIAVDFERLIKLDSLLKALPRTLDDIWNRISDGDQFLDLFKRAFRGLK
jgi:hypothetical protein